MKKFVFASFIAAASLGLSACAEPAEDTTTVEQDDVEVDLPDTDLTDLPTAEETVDTVEADEPMEPVAEVNPNGDASGPRPNEE